MKKKKLKNDSDFKNFYHNKKEINIIFDISGSSNYDLDMVKKYYFPKQDIKYHIILCDIKVCSYHVVDNINNFFIGNSYDGCAGTTLQKGVDFIINNLNKDNNLLIITDGYIEILDFKNYNGEILFITDACYVINSYDGNPNIKNIFVKN